MDPVLLPAAPVASLADYRAAGGLRGLERARDLGPAETVQEVSLARLRGRGGAGFATGAKWRSLRAAPGAVKYVVVNAAEGEPGTFKDRALLRANPYQMLEGAAIAAETIGAREVIVAIKGSFATEIARVERAIGELDAAGVFTVPVRVALGPDEYLFGEEKAMLEVIEGNAPLPRILPPYQHGLWATDVQLGWSAHDAESGTTGGQANPTLVNNVETLSNVAHILARGAEWYRGLGTDTSPGTIVCTVVGDVQRPGVFEQEMGTPLADLLGLAGGLAPGRQVKMILSGVSNAVILPAHVDTPLSYEGFAAIGSGLGAAGFIVYDDTACVVDVASLLSRFLYVESCGQCPACKLGCGEVTQRLEAVETGMAGEQDIEVIGARLRSVTDGSRCALPGEEQALIASLLAAFPEEFVDHLEGRGCASPRRLVMPKVLDLVDGAVVWDERYRRKQPDWTYA